MKGEKLGSILAEVAKNRSYNVADIARKTGLNEKTVKRCFDDEGSTKLSTIEAIKQAIGIKRVIHIVE